MTTPDFRTRDFTPNFDRIITREVTTTVEVPASTVYAYAELYIGGGGRLDDGTWRRESDTEIILALEDDNGLGFPQDLELPFGNVGVSWDGATPTLLILTALEVVKASPFTPIPVSTILTFDGPLPTAGAALAIGIDTGGTQMVEQTVLQPVWAQRRDFSWRDFSVVETGSLINIQDTRYVVRVESGPWAAMDFFTNEDGIRFNVQGVQQLGRQYLELLARSGGL